MATRRRPRPATVYQALPLIDAVLERCQAAAGLHP